MDVKMGRTKGNKNQKRVRMEVGSKGKEREQALREELLTRKEVEIQ